MKKVNCNNCSEDYYCCSNFHVTLTKEEVSSGLYKYKRLREVKENKKSIGFVWTLTCQENGFCMYFDNITKTCKIHDFKPTVCKNWNECELGSYKNVANN